MRFAAALVFTAAALCAQSPLRFEITWEKPADGRVILILSRQHQGEPRSQLSESLDTQQAFGVDVENARSAIIDASALGYPRESLHRIPAGDYSVQAVLNLYETFHMADGRILKLPMDQGEGQHWFRKPGNLYSEPIRARIDPASAAPIRLTLSRTMPTLALPADSKYIRHIRIESKLLTAFWGRPMHLGAIVVVPEGFDDHPDAHYPVLYYQGHFASTFNQLRAGSPFYRAWTGGQLPKMLIVLTQDANPFYDDSYAVNSANLGPYGDALTQELYPYVEQKFRGIGQGWSRAVYGGSTGGWRALALQLFHPDYFNLAWAVSPDPIDFRAFQLVNIYDDPNAFFAGTEWKQTPIPMLRDREGRIAATMEDALRFETVLGTKSRSGEQFDIWQAVYSPRGEDGYPAEIFNRQTGAIDVKVAAYWKEHYDLVDYMRRNWKTLGPQLTGKLRISAGVADVFYLERSVKLAQEFLEGTAKEGQGPYYAGSVEFDPNGGHGMGVPGKAPEKTFHERVMEALAERIQKTAPAGADLSWR